jgi:tetratricopeptide (TPR) repeat protein
MNVMLLIAIQSFLIAGVCGEHAGWFNQLIQLQGTTDAATKEFQEARDLIKNGEWAKAEQSFNRFIAGHPQDKDVAAALYWLALALKQQNKFQESDRALTQLIEKFPGSSWITDARAMRVEIAPRLKNNEVIEQGVSAENEEIKLAALQSLFEASPERAVAMAADILKPGSGASSVMKESAITMLADSDSKLATAVLVDAARNERDSGLRRKALQALGELEDERALDSLIQMYDAEKDERMKEVILSALGDSEEKKALRKIIDIARRDPSLKLKKKALAIIGESDDPEAVKFLEEILKKN